MEVICINDKDRPNVIPLSKWVKKGEKYTVLNVIKCNVQGGILGFELEEISLKGCEPYLYFAAHRFERVVPNVKIEDVELLEELIV